MGLNIYGRRKKVIEIEKEKAAQIPSVGAEGEQPNQKRNNEIIAEESLQINPANEKNRANLLNIISMVELYDTVYLPRRIIIDDLLYCGTYLFAGAPKIGKSFLMAQLSYHVAMGIPLWEHTVHQGTVLYLALEDEQARLQQRLSKMFGVEEASDALYFATEADAIQKGLEEQLEQFLQEHSDTRLIIIDTLQRIRETVHDRYSYASDYDVVTKLTAFSGKYNICILVVHHTRKMESDDSFDTISGTNGLLGAADGAFILQKKKRIANEAILDLVGRDQPDQRMELCFDREKCLWEVIKTETESQRKPVDSILEEIAAMLTRERPIWTGNATELAELLKLDLKANVLTRHLNVNASRLLNEYQIQYKSSRNHAGRKIELRLISE